MAAAIFDSTAVDIAAGRQLSTGGNTPYLFRANGSVLKFPGFLAVYNVDLDEGEEDEDKEAILPPLNEGEMLRLMELLALQHWTQPPPRFTEASLVKELEKLGIGRPSTYAPTISTIEAREYVQSVEKKLVPTSLGGVVTDLLVEHFPNIVDYNFTSQMEQQLDDIAEGGREWVPVIRGFYQPFEDTIAKAKRDMRGVKGETVETDIPCPNCSALLGIKWGKNGEFLACTRHPDCSFTGDLQRDGDGRIQLAAQPQLAEGTQICDKCSREMSVKQGRFGPFLACTGYPECKNIRNLQKAKDGSLQVAEQMTEHACPKCQKSMIRKSGRWGPYLACSDYPDCKTIQKLDRSGQPKPPAQITEKLCPESGHHLALKQGRWGPFLSCTGYPKCRYMEKLTADGAAPRILSDEEVEALPKPEPVKARASKDSTTKTTKRTSTASTANSTAKRTTAKSKTSTSAAAKTPKRTTRVKQPA
jgi:DNA topoisomerase-1